MKKHFIKFRKMRTYCLIAFAIIFHLQVNCAYGQINSGKNELQKSLDFMFEHIDKKSVPTGLLRDYAVEEEDMDIFTGECPLNENNICTPIRYASLLKTISSAALFNDPIQPFERTYKSRGESIEKNGTIRLGAMLFQYARIKSSAITQGLISLKNGQLYNNEKKDSPYLLEYVFAGCCLDNATNTSNVTFTLPSSFLLNNTSIQKLEIDYGAGFRNILYNESVKASLKNGDNDIKIRATLNNGKTLLAHTTVKVIENTKLKTRAYSDLVTINDYTTITGENYSGITTKADISVHYAPGHNSIQKPFIFVEGFDPRCISETTNGVWNIQRLNSYIDQLEKQGYDLIYVDWEKSEEYIQANAYTLIEVLKWVNNKKSSNGSNEPNVIMGHSMGGLIVRYALKTMENRGQKHDVDTYISYDVPHLGAHIPLGVLYGFNGIQRFLKEKGIINSLLPDDIKKYIKLGESMAYSTSAQQMLVYFVDPAGNFNNQEHITWQKELNALGFPKGDADKNLKMLAVANGCYQQPTVPQSYLTSDFSAGSDVLCLMPFGRLVDLGVTICLNDIVASMLWSLPGRTSVSGYFNIYPATAIGQRVTNINLKYKKTFLWTVPLSKTVFSYDRDFPGGYLFDTYPSSSYSMKENNDDNTIQTSRDLNIRPILDLSVDANVHSVPFIPTSSALAYGNGLNSNSSYYFEKPTGESSPFGENYYVHAAQKGHAYLTKNAMDWLFVRLSTCIDGSNVGYDGAQYKLSNAIGNVIWSTSNSGIATIDQQGILFVHGKGIISIVAKNQGKSYSQLIMVGMPRFILSASHEPGGYKIKAECIDNQYLEQLSNLNRVINYNWGIKIPTKDIIWIGTAVPNLQVELDSENEKGLVFLKVTDVIGNETPIQSIQINSQDVYVASNQKLYIDSQGNLYKENKGKYSYKSARLYLKYKENLSDKYKDRKWMATSAMVLSPYTRTQKISARDGGPLIKDILPESELEYITKGSDDGQVYSYVLILLNSDEESVQFVPVSFTFKTNIEK